jgi:multidrug efflux pump subunit AcrB
MKRIIAAFTRNTVFANIVLVLFFLAGFMGTRNIIKETFPEFSLDMIAITVPYPGADPEEVEESISRKIEDVLEGLEGVKQYTTRSMENQGTANIEVKKGYDVQEVLERIRSKVNAISTFPVDAERPIITEVILRDTVMVIDLSADMDERRLKEWVEAVKDQVQDLPGISRVSVFGSRDYEISIELSEERLLQYGLTIGKVADAIRRSNLNLAGGTLRTRGEEIRVRTVGRRYTGKEFSGIVVLAGPGGDLVTLDQLATIRDGFTEDPIRATVDRQRSMLLLVSKTHEEDALAISRTVNKFIRDMGARLPAGAVARVLYDSTDMLRARIQLLLKNGAIGISLVFLLLWVFLDLRLSFWVGLGVPVSLAGAVGILWGVGGTINMISLFGLIMVLGILVDDAIVVGESIYVHRKRGQPPFAAAVEGTSEVAMPVVAAVTTTIVAFLPLYFIGGIMGKFIAILPIVVVSALMISLVESLVLLPAHLSHLPELNHRDEKHRSAWRRGVDRFHHMTSSGLEWTVNRLYEPFLRQALFWRYISFFTAMAVLMLTLGLVRGGFAKFEVFPKMDGFVVTSHVEFPNGTPPRVTQQAVEQVEAALVRLNGRLKTLSGDLLVQNRLALVGQTLEQMPRTGPNVGSVQAFLLPSEKRGVHSSDILVAWEKEVGPIAGIKSLTFEEMEAGPPGAPIEVWLQGHEMPRILAAADDLMKRLAQFDGVYQIRSDFSPGKNELRLHLKPQARTLGLTVSDLARQIHSGYYGQEALRLQRGRDDIRVKVRYTRAERQQLSELEQVRIRTPGGREVPLMSVADISFGPGYATITRTDGMRRVAVSADVDTNRANANEIFAELSSSFFPRLRQHYPGLKVSTQGEKKKMRESFDSLFIGYPLALLGIFIIMATMFRSYVQPFIIMFTIPFGIIGAIFGHLLLGYDLSLMSVFGIVALTGVVVNDAIVLIERINENLAEGVPFFYAIRQGGARRFRAIILTTITTVGGLAPLIMETDMQARFLIPMAISMAAGVAFATVLTLVLIPSLLVILNDLRCVVFRIKRGRWPETREQVEPASRRRDAARTMAPPAQLATDPHGHAQTGV